MPQRKERALNRITSRVCIGPLQIMVNDDDSVDVSTVGLRNIISRKGVRVQRRGLELTERDDEVTKKLGGERKRVRNDDPESKGRKRGKIDESDRHKENIMSTCFVYENVLELSTDNESISVSQEQNDQYKKLPESISYDYENLLIRQSKIPWDFVIGVDEAGRGCLGMSI